MKALKDSSIYLIGEFASKSLPFLLLPYLTNKLGMEGFGELSYYQILTTIFVVLVGFCQSNAISRYYYAYGQRSVNFIMLSGYIYTFSIGVIGFITSLFFDNKIISYLVLLSVFQVLLSVQLSLIQCQKNPIKYTIIQVGAIILSISITIFMLEFYDSGLVEKRIQSLLYSEGLMFFLVFFIFNKSVIRFSLKNIKLGIRYILNFGFPLILHNFSGIIKWQLDKVLIYNIFSKSELGIYALGATIASIILTLIAAINQALLPYYYEALKKKKVGINEIKKWVLYSLLFIPVLWLVLINFPSEVLSVFVEEEQEILKYYIIIFSLTALLNIPYTILVNYLFFYSKNKYVTYCSLSSTVLYLLVLLGVLSFLDIKYIPYAGVLSSVFMLLLLWFYVKKVDAN